MNEDAQIANHVAAHGWCALSVTATPPFVYTVGLLTQQRHPEVILFGFDSATAREILASVVREIGEGHSFAERGEHPGICEGFSFVSRPVHPTQHIGYLGYAMGHVRHTRFEGELSAVQLFWPDEKGRYPFDAGCDEDVYARQPRLDISLTPSELAEQQRWLDTL